MDCTDAEALIAAFAVGSPDEPELPMLRSHLTTCAECRVTAGAYVSAAAQLPLALTPAAPPPQLRAKIMAAVYSDASGAHAAPPREPLLHRLWRHVPSARGWTLAGAGAMAVAVVGVGWIGLSSHQSTAPSATTVSMAGTTAQPLAHGRLTIAADTREAVLTVDGLAPLEGRSNSSPTYEVWLVQPGGRAEPAAYLTAAPRGGTWSAAFSGELNRYSAVAVTLEPSPGNVTPSGTEVMRAELAAAH